RVLFRSELAQRPFAVGVELQYLPVQRRGARVEAFLEVVVGKLEEPRRGGLPLAGALAQVGQLLDDVPVGRRLAGRAFVDADGQVVAALSLVPVGLADEFLPGGEGVGHRQASSSRSNSVGGRKDRRWAALRPCSRIAARCSAV